LNGIFEFPHLIIPTDSSSPTKAPGTSYFGEVTSTKSSIFNFDIPDSDTGKTCSLVFLFPTQSILLLHRSPSVATVESAFSLLNGVANSATSYANAPSVKIDYGVTTVASGNSYSIATFPCPGGTAISFELKASRNIPWTTSKTTTISNWAVHHCVLSKAKDMSLMIDRWAIG